MKKQLIAALVIGLTGFGAMAALPKSASIPQRLIQSEVGLMAPVWSPDGQKIAVTSDNYTGIYVAKADGSQLQKISEKRGEGYRMEWSADSRIVNPKAKISSTKSSVYDIMVNDPANATMRIASLAGNDNLMVINPTMSPDGQKIAFQIVSKGVFVCDANGENLIALGKGSHPAWLADNNSLVITRVQDNGAVFTASQIFAIDITTGNEVLLTSQEDMIPLTPAVSPDGKKVAFENAIDAGIYFINLNY